MFDNYILALQCITIVTGLLCLRRSKPVILWLLWLVTILAFINENILVPHAMGWWGIPRNLFYNIYALLDILIWAGIFFFILGKTRYAAKIILISGGALVIYKITTILSNSVADLAFIPLTIFCVLCIFASIYYFSSIMRPVYYDITLHPAFWACCASLSFHSVLLVNLLTLNYNDYWEDDFSELTFDILQFMGITFYNLFICAAFLLSSYNFKRTRERIL